MLKKVLVAGVAVALALSVAYFLVPRRLAEVAHRISTRLDAVEESIPPERKIEMLKSKIKSLEADDPIHVHRVAKLRAEVKEFETTVNTFRESVKSSERRIVAMDAALKAEGRRVSYESREWERSELTRAWEQAVDSLRLEDRRLQAMEAELTAKRQTLDVATRNLNEMRLVREELRADLATLQAELDLERRAVALERNVAADPKAAEARAELSEIRRQINVMKEERNIRRELRGGNAVRNHEEQKKAQDDRDVWYRERFGSAVNKTSGATK